MKNRKRFMSPRKSNPCHVSRTMLVLSLAAGICGVALDSQGQQTPMVTFDISPLPLPAFVTETYFEWGMEFKLSGTYSAGGGVMRFASGYWAHPDNGTTYLMWSATNALGFGLTTGELFDLVSVDLAESFLSTGRLEVQIIGYRHDGSIITTTLMTDGIMDGTGPLNDFETFHFGSNFSNLLRVEIPTRDWALDNLVFSVVPEPSSLALWLCGGLLLAGQFRKR